MSAKADAAVATFGEGFNCAQAVLSACGKGLGLSRRNALKIATGFGGGMGRLGEVCGAVTGAFMVIGLKHGRSAIKDDAARAATQDRVQEFVRRFRGRNQSIICRELIGCEICTPEGYAQAQQKGVFKTLCPKLVRDASEILEEIA